MSDPAPQPAIQSPCVKTCIVDGASGLCLGCLRTLPELARWTRYTDAERGGHYGRAAGAKGS